MSVGTGVDGDRAGTADEGGPQVKVGQGEPQPPGSCHFFVLLWMLLGQLQLKWGQGFEFF